MCPGSPAASVPQNKLGWELVWTLPTSVWFVAPCCTMLHHVAPTIFMQLLLLLWGSWCRRVIDPANVCAQNLSIHTTCYAWCFWRVDLWSFLLRCRHASIVWTMSRHLCQKDRNSVRPISRQLKSFLWQGLLWMTQSHCMYEKADHSLLHNVCIVSRYGYDIYVPTFGKQVWHVMSVYVRSQEVAKEKILGLFCWLGRQILEITSVPLELHAAFMLHFIGFIL